ncbi:hypothetical protein CUMW_056000 [Citrus unshiu]|nr:hypothetical protein CUMW_056000 [Citrus unshiu]
MYSPTPSPRRRTRLLLALLPSSAIFLLLFVLSAVSVTTLKKNPKTTDAPHLRVQKHFQVAHSACEGTLYPELCVSTLLSVPDLASKRVPELISVTINRTLSELRASSSNCSSIGQSYPNFNTLEKRAINDCLELFHDTIVELKSALNDLSPKKSPSKHYHDLQTLFSGAMTNQYTCLDGFAYSDGNVRDVIKSSLYNISRHVSNSLVMLKKIPGDNMSSKYEVFPEYGRIKRGFPTWLSLNDRKLLQKSVNLTKFDLIVAKDGSGNFTTITEAVEAAPNKSNTRFVIYIKAGAYFENVEVDKKKTMLMFVGDGIGKTVVKANRSVVDGWTTFRGGGTIDDVGLPSRVGGLLTVSIFACSEIRRKSY